MDFFLFFWILILYQTLPMLARNLIHLILVLLWPSTSRTKLNHMGTSLGLCVPVEFCAIKTNMFMAKQTFLLRLS